MSGSDVPLLDREGEWEIAVTIRRNGRKVAHLDVLGSYYDDAIVLAETQLELRRVEFTARHAKEADR